MLYVERAFFMAFLKLFIVPFLMLVAMDAKPLLAFSSVYPLCATYASFNAVAAATPPSTEWKTASSSS